MTSQEELLNKLKDNLLITLGKRVQELREAQGLSQVDLAGKMLGKFDTTNISRIESGRTNPTIFTLFRIAEALEVPLHQILIFEDSK
ncbi:helix-turn-helix transcriptional regulator [Polaribacter sp. R2A056_3_33]|jgi:transcriptional regulator with XRE-family HTH domain|uniref:helix-turn-helix domain-containing protein n=1 Tax=Polaribacter sp. R2A056_3_33 TaxID=2745563 RepID=UPI001C50072C|nr:helix-turn-helix transcriptional regulator [Polaribacter sp. R2A056_3_33]QXP69374.1 helix-turn-helix transcriptional regulator [Polaribacter sp. R2A056_3_33]